MNASRSRRRIRLTPFGYLVLSVLVLVILFSIYLIVRAAGGASLSPAGRQEASVSVTPEPGTTPEAGGLVIDVGGAAAAATEEVTASPIPTPTINAETPVPSDPPTPSPSPAMESRLPTAEEEASAVEGKLSTGGVNLRAGPSTNDAIIGQDYAKGTRLKVYAHEGDFYFVQIIAKGKYGFVAAKFVNVADMTPVPIATVLPENAVGGTITASTVALRNGPGKDYSLLKEYERGTQVYIYYQTGEWFYLEIAADGATGYMKASFFDTQGTVPAGTPTPS